MKCFSSFCLKTPFQLLQSCQILKVERTAYFLAFRTRWWFGDTAENTLRKTLRGGGGGGESQVTCQRLCLQQIFAVHGHLAPFALRLQAGEKSLCFFHPNTVALVLSSLEMPSCKDLPVIFFPGYIRELWQQNCEDHWPNIISEREIKHRLAGLWFPGGLFMCSSVPTGVQLLNLIAWS